MYVYIESEPRLFTVGYYKPSDRGDAEFVPERDHASRDEAAQRVHYLNGGTKP